ncbi:MAG: permease-like cell division protein FtsX [Mycobacteriales bacterium]|nr:MAG: ABC transporter permease [Pseudonocardiales bacterium]
MRLRFVLSEVWTGLRRNLTMTIAMILTTAISLVMLGGALIIAREIGEMKSLYYGQIEVSIFLQEKVTPAQQAAIGNGLKTSPEVERVVYESKADAYKRFKKIFSGQPSLVQGTPPSFLPASFRVKLHNPEHYPVIAQQFAPKNNPGVYSVQDDGAVLNKLFSILNGLRNGAIIIAVVQALAALLLISNTIQVAAFSRRTETGIMRLVGASRWYTQLPFILEAAIAGLIGSVLAVGGLGLAKRMFIDKTFAGVIRQGLLRPVDWNAILVVSPVLAAVGVLLASVAAYLTLRLYVRI